MTFFDFSRREDVPGGLGPPPPVFRIRRRDTGAERFRIWIVVGLLLLLLILAANALKGLVADWLWFDSVGYGAIFRSMATWRVGLFLAGAAIFVLFWLVNLLVAGRGDRTSRAIPRQQFQSTTNNSAFRLVVMGTSAVGALMFGGALSSQWNIAISFVNRLNVGQVDPLLGRDLGFYFFSLPLISFLHGWLLTLVILTAIAVGLVRLNAVLGRDSDGGSVQRGRIHLAVLIALILALVAGKYWLDRFDLLFSAGGLIFGATYADVYARLPILNVLIVASAILALIVPALVILRRSRVAIAAVAVWVLAAVLLQSILPSSLQRVEVQPNELVKETPFIERNIQFTRWAYGLDRIEERSYPAAGSVSAVDLRNNSETVDNIRLWDHRPLLETFNQTQSLRPLYRFTDVDIDRYVIGGVPRQVMVSGRELIISNLAARARTWVNERLQFTHGYGLVMTPVNEVVQEGLPTYFLRDIPVTGTPTASRPEIYFGEQTNHYIVVKSGQPEFDYPMGDTNATTVFQGSGGIRLDNWFRKFIFAWHFGDANILLSQQLQPESLLLYRRNVAERLRTITPFIQLDADPYLVLDGGRLYWIVDGYTTSSRVPYSQPNSAGKNYIRNSVKVVVDAYDGTTTYYLADPEDPIAAVYARSFPSLFRPLDEMPSGLRAHLRYPEGLFQMQSDMYRLYHIRDPRVFYNKEDVWDVPNETLGDQQQPIEPYYVIMKLPGESRPEFILMMPMSPVGRQNTVVWIAARMDAPNYGQMLAFRFPTDSLVFGPAQIETRIDQTPAISQQLTLWNQSGSRVVRGNLLMIPIAGAILYVEPIYLRAESNQLPELKRVVAVTGSSIAMEATLDEALAAITGGRAPATTPTTASGQVPPAQVPTLPPSNLVSQAREAYDKAQESLRQGDFAGYGREIARLDDLLKQLQQTNPQ